MVKSTLTMAIQAVKELRRTLRDAKGRMVHAYVHPDVAQRLLQQEKKAIRHLERSTQTQISIYPEPKAHREDINITFVK